MNIFAGEFLSFQVDKLTVFVHAGLQALLQPTSLALVPMGLVHRAHPRPSLAPVPTHITRTNTVITLIFIYMTPQVNPKIDSIIISQETKMVISIILTPISIYIISSVFGCIDICIVTYSCCLITTSFD